MAAAAFPRGGAGVLSPLEVRSAVLQAERDVAFEETLTKKKPKKRVFPRKEDEEKSSKQLKRSLETLSFKKLREGMVLLGAIKEVREYDATVSLPNGLSGFIHAADVSGQYTKKLKDKSLQEEEAEEEEDGNEGLDGVLSLSDILPVGLLVRCCILELKVSPSNHHRIRLTLDPVHINKNIKPSFLRPGLVLSGCVDSIEDHGYMISFGLPKKNGFLSNANAADFVEMTNQGKCLCVGQVVSFIILPYESSDLKTVPVSARPKELMKLTCIDGLISFEMLTAGMLVKSTVTQVSDEGLFVTFLGGFTGMIGYLHLRDGCTETTDYHVNQKVKGRILYVNHVTKVAGISLQNSVCSTNRAHQFGGVTVGDIFESKVIRVDPYLGLLVEVEESWRGFVHISRISDSHIDKIQGKKFKAGTIHRSRVLGFNTLDGVAILSLRKHVLEQPFISYGGITVGSMVTGTVLSLESFGVRLSISEHIQGLIPSLHLADVGLIHPEKKFKEGKKVQCRVLEVNARCHKLLLTHKKTLVKSSLPPLCTKEDAYEGAIYHGTIVSIRHYGCIVAFYGKVKGLIHKTELSSHVVDDPASCFHIGQVVQCRVASTSYGKLRFSLREAFDNFHSLAEAGPTRKINLGMVVEVSPNGVSERGLTVDVLPEKTTAFVPSCHLSDHLDHCHQLLAAHSKVIGGQEKGLYKAIVINEDQTRLRTLSFKPSLRTDFATNQADVTFDDLKAGMVMVGWIHQIMPYGCFVKFPSGLVGLAPLKYLTDKFLNSADEAYKVGQSVYAKVVEVEMVKHRFLLSLCLSDLQDKTEATALLSGLDLLQSFLQEKHFIDQSTLQQEKGVEWSVLSLRVGSLVQGKVTDKSNLGLFVKLNDTPFKCFVPPGQFSGSTKVDEDVLGVVLDHDIVKNLIYVSLKQDLVESWKMEYRQELVLGEFVDVCVELVNSDYVLVSLPGKDHQLAIAPSKQHLNFPTQSQTFFVGQTIGAEVASVTDSEETTVTGLPVVVIDERTSSTHISAKQLLAVGGLVKGRVKSVQRFQLNVSLGDKWYGRIHITELFDAAAAFAGENPLSKFRQGQEVEGVVIGFRDSKTYQCLPVTQKNLRRAVVEVSLRQSLITMAKEKSSDEMKLLLAKDFFQSTHKGDSVLGFVNQIGRSGLTVLLTPSVRGKVHFLNCSSNPDVVSNPTSTFKVGQSLSLDVVDVRRLETIETIELAIGSVQCEPGSVAVCQFGKEVPGKGVYVQLPRRMVGFVALTDMSDEFCENAVEKLPAGSFSRCFLLCVDGRGHFDVSLRKSRICPNESLSVIDREICSVDDIQVGEIVRGYISSVAEKGGIFVRLGRNVTGRVKITHLFDGFVKKWSDKFRVGELVKAKVLSIDDSSGCLELSLKVSHVRGLEESKGTRMAADSKAKRRREEPVTESDSEEEHLEEPEEEECSPEEDEDEGQQTSLKLPVSFNWKVPVKTVSKEEEEERASDDIGNVKRRVSKRQVRAERAADELKVTKRERSLLDETSIPQSADDFDRCLASSPNSSMLWLQYMAHYTHVAEFDKARAVAQRALTTIPFQEESEKLNVWTGLMNLENLYGTEETLLQVFESALKQNDPLSVFCKLVHIYVESNKFDWAVKLYQTMVKRFNTNADVWIAFGTFYMQRGKRESARGLLQRSLKSLPKNEHVDVICKFGQIEFEHGDPERGRAIFDGILKSYPKRVDVWKAYIDLMMKQEKWESVRETFEQALCLKFSKKVLKMFLKRYQEFEEKHGDEDTKEAAKMRAASLQ